MNVEMSAGDVLHVAFRHKVKLIGVFAACVFGAVDYNLFATPQYAVNASLLINLSSSVPLQGQPGDSRAPATEETEQDIINSYKAILQGHDLVLRALQKVGIAKVYPELVSDPPARMTIEDAAVLAVGVDLFVDNPRSTDLLTMTLINPDAHVGLDMVSALIQGFIDKRGNVISNPQAGFLSQKVTAAKAELDVAQEDLQQFRIRYNVSDVGRALDEISDQKLALESKLRDAEQSLAGLQMQRQALADGLGHSIARNVQLYSDDDLRYRSMDDAHTKLTELRLQQSELLRNYAPSSEPVVRNQAQINLIDRTLKQYNTQKSSRVGANPVYQDIQTDMTRVEGQIANARATHDAITRQISAVDETLRQLQQSHGSYLDLQRRYELAEQQYRDDVHSMEQAATDDSLHRASITDVSLVEPPTFASKPVRPRRLINVLMGAVLGLIGGFMAAIVAELADDRISQPYQLGRKIKVPVLQTLPTVSPGRGSV
jgi:tyrosine-protein kinase Etk/Wzc